MTLDKIVKIIVAIIGVVALFFLVRILMLGDDAIANDVSNQGIIGSFITLALIVLIATAFVTIAFSLINLIKHPDKLKQALISLVLFLVVIAIAYFASTEWIPKGSEDVITPSQSKWVETGIKTFYFLVIAALGAMLWGGVKKVLSR